MLNLSSLVGRLVFILQDTEQGIRFCDQIVFNPQEAQVTTDVFRSDRRWIKATHRSLRKRASLDDDFEQMLEAFVENRNILIHRALNQPWWKAKNEGQFEGALAFLKQLLDQTESSSSPSKPSFSTTCKKTMARRTPSFLSRFGKVVIWMRSRIFRNSRKPPSKRRPGLRTSPERRANRKLRLGRYACSSPRRRTGRRSAAPSAFNSDKTPGDAPASALPSRRFSYLSCFPSNSGSTTFDGRSFKSGGKADHWLSCS